MPETHSISKEAISNLSKAGFIQDINPGQLHHPSGGRCSGYRMMRERGNNNAPTSDGTEPLVSVVTVVKDDAKGLEETIQCIKEQNYANIEHIVIDGESSNNSVLLAICNRYGIAMALSEPDLGIYDAMNKGIAYAQGKYICVLNAGDTYASGFINEACKTLEREDNGQCVAYGGIEREDTAPAMDDGILVHHLHINHQGFMVPAAVYKEIGGYSILYRVVSDIAWARVAYLSGIKFTYVGAGQLRFASGGLSSSAKYRELIKRENAELNKAVFAELSIGQAQEIYEFRFRAALALNVSMIVGNCSTALKDSLRKGFSFLLKCKAFVLRAEAVDSTFIGLFELCSVLSIRHSEIKFTNSPNTFNAACQTIEAFTENCDRQPGKKKLLHYAEVFSRPSETFIYDVIKRNEILANAESLVLCDQRLLKDERPHPYVVVLKWSAVHPVIREALYGLIFSMEWSCIVCHFGINSARLLMRLPRHQWGKHRYLHMLHGIDVFTLRDANSRAYRSTLVEHVAKLSNHSFTTPSKFLKARAGLEGLPTKKIAVVHNCANKRFYENRKRQGFYGTREGNQIVQLLAIGRLIQWKNHSTLLSALGRLQKDVSTSYHLTIVYGKDDTMKSSLESQVQELGLNGKVDFVGFVDFNQNPTYLSHFDLFIMPSGYSSDGMRKTETFGVATLEAIASGMPVLVSDAGASNEILDHAELGNHAMVFKHNSADDLAEKLKKMLENKDTFTDNNRLALQILDKYSEQAQVELLWKVIERYPSTTLSVIHFSADATGGAGGAAWRCHRGLREAGTNSIFVCRKFNRIPTGYVSSEIIVWNDTPECRYNSKQPPQSFGIKPGNSIFSVDEEHFSLDQLTQLVNGFDIVHLNWVSRFLTVKDIAFLGKTLPVAYTIRDMNPITGGCHYLHGCNQLMDSCEAPCPQTDYKHRSIPNHILEAKMSNWQLSQMAFIGISKITSAVARQSRLGKMAKEIDTIPNGFTSEYMAFLPMQDAKLHLGLREDEKAILFVPSYSSSVKGADIAIRALKSLRYQGELESCTVLIAGEVSDGQLDLGQIRHTHIGYIQNKSELNRVYAACDLVLVPSLEETFSNTCAEAMLCGAPVVGFRSGGIPEMIIDGETGYLAEEFQQDTLSVAIKTALGRTWNREAIRASLLTRFSMEVNSKKHLELYQRQLCASTHNKAKQQMIRLTSVDRMIHCYKGKVEKRALTTDAGLDRSSALVSGCKKAIVWISDNGYLCLTQLGHALKHYVWTGQNPSQQSLAGLKPISKLILTDSSIVPKAYSGQSLQPVAEFAANLSGSGIYVTLSGTLDFNVRSRDGDKLIASLSILSTCQLLEDASMVDILS